MADQERHGASKGLQVFGVVGGALASLICLAAGIWILYHEGFKSDDAVTTGIGLYFIGKAVFVGPMLAITALRR